MTLGSMWIFRDVSFSKYMYWYAYADLSLVLHTYQRRWDFVVFTGIKHLSLPTGGLTTEWFFVTPWTSLHKGLTVHHERSQQKTKITHPQKPVFGTKVRGSFSMFLGGWIHFLGGKWMFPKLMGKPPKSSILIGFSIINHPFWGTPIFGNIQIFFGAISRCSFNLVVSRLVK